MNKIRKITIKTSISKHESRETTHDITPTTIIEVTLNSGIGKYSFGDTVELEDLLAEAVDLTESIERLEYKIDGLEDDNESLEETVFEQEMEIDKLKETITKLMAM